MARGWESKSVEDQQSEFKKAPEKTKPIMSAEERERVSQKGRLRLARANVASQLEKAQNQRYREMLQRELDELDRLLQALG